VKNSTDATPLAGSVALAVTVNGFGAAPLIQPDGAVIATVGGAVSTLASAVTTGVERLPTLSATVSR
jgi:hypothetical protein